MLLVAENLFRIDIAVTADTLRTLVRNLSSGELELDGSSAGEASEVLVFGQAAAYQPSQTRIKFKLGAGTDSVSVVVLIGVLHFRERGTVRVTSQATVARPSAV